MVERDRVDREIYGEIFIYIVTRWAKYFISLRMYFGIVQFVYWLFLSKVFRFHLRAVNFFLRKRKKERRKERRERDEKGIHLYAFI